MENLEKYEITNDPIDTFLNWFDKAKELDSYADAFALATSDKSGDVSVRYLLFKGILEQKFSFYTNYNSSKSSDIESNPRASMAFFWRNFGRQVRISGDVTKTSTEQSKKYFDGRGRDSQIASYVSDQSSSIADKETLLKKYSEKSLELEGKDVPYPSNWGGFLIDPKEIEFFIYGEFRLNDRILFKKNSNNQWSWERLQP